MPTYPLPSRHLALVIALILALSLGGLRNAQACAFGCADAGQTLDFDDADGGDGEACIFATVLCAVALRPDNPPDGPCVYFFPSLKTPPANPPPIRA